MTVFDPRNVLLARHAQHVVLIHFPIAMFISGALFDMLSRGQPDSPLGAAAYFNLLSAGVTMAPTVATGFLAWRFALEGQHLKGFLLWHLVAASVAAALVIVCALVHWHSRRQVRRLPGFRIVLEAVGVVTLAVTAHLGGFLSGVNG